MPKRLRLIPQHEWELFMKCKSELNSDTQSDNLKLLNDPNLPPDIKLSLYNQDTKRKFQAVKPVTGSKEISTSPEPANKIPRHHIIASETKQNQFDASTSVHDQVTEEEIEKFITSSNIQVNSRTYHHALHFLTILKNSPKLVAWNSKGQISFSQGELIPGTSIKDVVIRLFRNIHYPEPVAFQRILHVMKFLKIPPNLILNKIASFLYNISSKHTKLHSCWKRFSFKC